MLENNNNEKILKLLQQFLRERYINIRSFLLDFTTIVALYIFDVITNKAAHNCQNEKVILFIEREIKYYTYTHIK